MKPPYPLSLCLKRLHISCTKVLLTLVKEELCPERLRSRLSQTLEKMAQLADNVISRTLLLRILEVHRKK